MRLRVLCSYFFFKFYFCLSFLSRDSLNKLPVSSAHGVGPDSWYTFYAIKHRVGRSRVVLDELTGIKMENRQFDINNLTTLYSSLPLPRHSRSIRILDVEPSASSDDESIRGQLRVVSLDDNNMEFSALSYVWGAPASPPRMITCGLYSIPITANCWSALWHLRKHFGSMSLWIDSVCINQDDLAEKQSQIPMMGDIYSRSRSVYAWLGEGTAESDMAIDCLREGGFQRYLSEKGDLSYTFPKDNNSLCWKIAWDIHSGPTKAFVSHLRWSSTFVPSALSESA